METDSHTASGVRSSRRRPRPWPVRRIGLANLLVVVAALGDVLTTYVILTTPRSEGNVVLNALARRGVGVAMFAFVGFCLVLVGVALLERGWLSDVAGTYVLLAMGFSTVNNAVAFATGVVPLSHLFADPATAIAYGFPLCGLALGTWRAYRRRGTLPWREVLSVSAAVVAAVVALPILLA
ncbi:hypothetical protein ACFO0N_11380 [Halobium salinum]|uniref:DUF5658 domain-containing protein n=1 Tax=Halobium salinum TaxID=1364940 RepID=A0ABD5PD16_9EURY|nr:hypothetical protein [Halobium salinum]